MAKSEVETNPNTCQAKDRSTCPYHGEYDTSVGAVQKAKVLYDDAVREQVEHAIKDKPTDKTGLASYAKQEKFLKTRVTKTKNALNKTQAKLDALPMGFKKLNDELKNCLVTGEGDLISLHERVNRAEQYKQDLAIQKLREGRIEKQRKAEENARIKAEKEAEKERKAKFDAVVAKKAAENATPTTNDWKSGYKKAMTNVIVEKGSITTGERISSYGMYFPKRNDAKNEHLRKCGALDVSDVEEDAWEEWDHDSFDNNKSHMEYHVRGKVTCNCGEIACEPIEVEGTFSSLLSDMLKF